MHDVIGPRPIASRADLEAVFGALVDRWADRRCYRALRPMLNGGRLGLGLTDDWKRVREALMLVIADAGLDLKPEERDAIDESIAAVDLALAQQSGT